MDVMAGLAFQSAGPRFLNQVNQPSQAKNPVTEGVSLSAVNAQTGVNSFSQDSTDFKARQTPTVVALLDQAVDTPKITVGTKVLILGDSQTVGPYGKSIDELARATGATVSTHASWGASPYWFFNGNETYKYWTRDTVGQEDTRMQTGTPLLKDLLAAVQPDVVVVTMGEI